MGLPYDHSHRFTLSDLLDYSITEYIDNIVETCLKAEAEHKVEKMLAVMRARWESRRLRVDHVPSKPFSFAVTEIVQPHPVLKEKTTTFALDTDQAPELLKDTFCIVVDTEDLCLWLEDDIMNLQVLLSSAREGKVSGHIAHLLDLLQRVQEILSLMTSRQTQVQPALRAALLCLLRCLHCHGQWYHCLLSFPPVLSGNTSWTSSKALTASNLPPLTSPPSRLPRPRFKR